MSHLVDGQLVGVPLGDALDAAVDDGDLDVGTLERHHAARGTPHVTGPDAANLGDNHCAFNKLHRFYTQFVSFSARALAPPTS